jgi:hypothetical protein
LQQPNQAPYQRPEIENRPFAGQQMPRVEENRQPAAEIAPARPVTSNANAGGVRSSFAGSAMAAESQRNAQQRQVIPVRPAYNANRPATPATPAVRPALPTVQAAPPTTQRPETAQRPFITNPTAAPPGHLGSWLNQHNNMPVQSQEQLLKSEPSYQRLPAADQQRVMRQLQQVNQLPDQERQRRLARAETIERMSPQERMQLNQSSQRLATMPADRQALVKRAFRDLRGVPLDQRQTVLNSQRYQGQFSPDERGILTNLLRAEPYEPAQ